MNININKKNKNKNKTNKKYRKTRKLKSKNKRDKKNKKGGKIGDDIHNRRIGSIVVTLTAAEMTSKIEEHVFISGNIEVCGVYVLVSDGSSLTSPIDYHGESIRRPLCTTPEKTLYAIIWHTHPYSSKFYPSIQDIMTIKKKRKNGERIQISIIYTSLGVWIMKSLNDDITHETENEIEKITTQFYRKTNHGRFDSEFNVSDDIINEFTGRLRAHGIEVVLLKNDNIVDYQIELNNVREDAIYGWSPP